MNENDNRRSMVLRRVNEGALSLEQATRILNLSYRQLKRVWKRYREEGEEGLAHRSKGKPSNRAFQDDLRREILRLYREHPACMGPTRFAGRLAEQGIRIDHETLRRWLLDSGSWTLKRTRLPGRRAERVMSGFGEMLSLVSIQDAWLGADAQPLFLLCLRDEATGLTLFSLAAEESCDAVMRMLGAWIERFGIPVALRCLRRFHYEENRRLTLDQQLAGRESFSPLAQSCDRVGIDLGVMSPATAKGILCELSPSAETLRVELRARPTAGIDEANARLLHAVDGELNRSARSRVKEAADYHVAIVDGTDLRRVLCVDRECRVERSGVVALGTRRFRLMKGFGTRGIHPSRVVVSEWLDGTIHILSGGREIPFLEVRRAAARTDRMVI